MHDYQLFTSESVSEGHPDKMADQISDALLDAIMREDLHARVACETLVKTGAVVLAGEISTTANIDIERIVRDTVNEIGYNHSDLGFDGSTCAVINMIGKQSPEIAQGVDRQNPEDQGAGDQGLMFGYASNETEVLMPAPIEYAHRLMERQSKLRRSGELPWLRPDAKAQVTLKYANGIPSAIDAVVLSTQHDPDVSQADLQEAVMESIIKQVIPAELLHKDTRYHINPTGKFVIGGPVGDAGLTGRKIIVDTYGGMARHGGGAFSGKDPSKVDRSAAYATRHIAKNLVAAGVADEVLVQVSYAIGVAEPCGLFINTYGTSKVGINDGDLAKKVQELFDLRPYAIEQNLKLRNPIYQETAAYGHMGRDYYVASKTFNKGQKNELTIDDLEFFTWEKLDRVEDVKKAFGL